MISLWKSLFCLCKNTLRYIYVIYSRLALIIVDKIMLKWNQTGVLNNENLAPTRWEMIAIRSATASFLLFAPLTNARKGNSGVTSYQTFKSDANYMLKRCWSLQLTCCYSSWRFFVFFYNHCQIMSQKAFWCCSPPRSVLN